MLNILLYYEMSNVLSRVITWILNSLAEIYNLATECLGMLLASSLPVHRTTALAQKTKVEWNPAWPALLSLPLQLDDMAWLHKYWASKKSMSGPADILSIEGTDLALNIPWKFLKKKSDVMTVVPRSGGIAYIISEPRTILWRDESFLCWFLQNLGIFFDLG